MSWCKKGEYNAQISQKIRATWVQVGKHSQQMCPRPYLTGKFVTKPMSYVAALHLHQIKLGAKSIRSLRPL